MTQGDYAFFSFSPTVSEATVNQPWIAYNLTGQNLTYRYQAFSALKLVIGQNLTYSIQAFCLFKNEFRKSRQPSNDAAFTIPY